MTETSSADDGTRTVRTRGGTSNGVPWWLLFVAAIALAGGFMILAIVTYSRADDAGMTETVWTRIILILQSLQAVAFTAIGWLFGREVHRGEAQQAKEKARSSDANAAHLRQEAEAARQSSTTAWEREHDALQRAADAETKGWRLAEAVRAQGVRPHAARPDPGSSTPRTADAFEASGSERAPEFGSRGVGDEAVPANGYDHARSLADSLFPAPH